MASGYTLEMETTAGCCFNGSETFGRPLIAAEVKGGGAFTVIDMVALDTNGFGVDESVTENVIEVVPTGAVVAPDSIQVVLLGLLTDPIQVAGSSLSPTGNVPVTMAQVYGPVPPATVPSDCETSGVPSVSVRGEDVMFSKPATKIVSCCCVVTGEVADAGV
jgi:hypothetical protein